MPPSFVLCTHLFTPCPAQALSPAGRCKTFDATADGYGRGEGCAAVVLTHHTTSGSPAAGLLAVVKGSAVNTAGRSSGLTAPSGPAQQKLLVAALAAGNLRAADVASVSVHGTGTALGDPIGRLLPAGMQWSPSRPASGRLQSYGSFSSALPAVFLLACRDGCHRWCTVLIT